MQNRQVVLDTETTGIRVDDGHRVIEIGCVELIDRRLTGRHFQTYLNPERDIDAGSVEVHGLSAEFLQDKPLFAQIADQFYQFICGAQLIIHNAPFDLGFINSEFERLNSSDYAPIAQVCSVLDTLVMARDRYPGAKNNLDALCRRYQIDNSSRDYHGALLDAQLLAQVYLQISSGQVDLLLAPQPTADAKQPQQPGQLEAPKASTRVFDLPVITASAQELHQHEQLLQRIDRAAGKRLWP